MPDPSYFPAFNEFVGQSREKQSALLKEMGKLHKEEIDAAFKEYAVVVFCGSWKEPAYSAVSISGALTEEQKIELGRKRGFAPLSFSHGQLDYY